MRSGWRWALGAGLVMLLAGGASAVAYSQGRPIGTINVTRVDGHLLEIQTARQWLAMKAAAARAGINLVLTSGFRTIEEQRVLWEEYQRKLALWKAGQLPQEPTPAARPGYSNHQNGVAIDVATGGNNQNSPQYRWLAQHAATFGFKNTGATFSVPEFWHWERVAVIPLA